MVRKIIVLALACLVNSCAAQEKTTDKKLLVYDNYTDKKELLPISLDKYRLKNIVLHKKDTLKIDMPFPKGTILDKEDELFHFLCEQDIISGWLQLKNEPDSIMTKDSGMIHIKMIKKEVIESTKSSVTRIKLIGYIKIAEDLTSTLIQTDVVFEEEGTILKNLYVLNERNHEILSMGKIAYYFVIDDVIKAHTVWQGGDKFILYDDLVYTHDVSPENPYFYEEEPLEKVVFSITKDGKVLLLD